MARMSERNILKQKYWNVSYETLMLIEFDKNNKPYNCVFEYVA